MDTGALKAFVLERGKAGGGFAATPRLPATLEDTFYALEILAAVEGAERLGPVIDLGAQQAFLRAWAGRAVDLRWRLAWFLDRARRLAGLPSAPLLPERAPDSAEECFYQHRLSPALAAPRQYPLRTCRDRYFHLLLRRTSMDGAEARETSSWFAECQNPDGGFGFFPGTTSYIENCHFCLAALALLGKEAPRPAAALDFIRMCQRRNGGFARNPRAAPFLDASWHAVRAATALEANGFDIFLPGR